MKNFKIILVTLVLLLVFTFNVYGLEARNLNELEGIILEQMNTYNPKFHIKYNGFLDDIEGFLENLLDKDTYVKSNVLQVHLNVSGSKSLSDINVTVDYIIRSEERAEADKIIDEILADIIEPTMNDHEKVKAIHDYIILNSQYDKSKSYYSDYDLLTKGKSVCNGYALLVYNMLNKLNIPVKLVTGSSLGEGHIWNMVKLDDYWFHLDVTWNSPDPDMGSISYKYYMLTEKEISKDHTIDPNLEVPKANKKYYDCLKELSYDKILIETGLDMYDKENSAKNESELIAILRSKISHRPLSISVRFDRSISQDSLHNAMSKLAVNDYISQIVYSPISSDNTGEWNVLNLFIKYDENPDKIILDFPRKVNNTAIDVNFNVYAMYGNKKVNITKDVYIYPYDKNKKDISKGTLKFKEPGNYNLIFEYQGLQDTIPITGLNSNAFNYITDEKTDNYVNIKVYDQYIDFSSIGQWPFIDKGRTMVPLRAVFEVLNCQVDWEESSRSALVDHGTTKIIIPANSTTAYINGRATPLDVPARIVNNRIMIPLRFVSEAIDKTVIWDEAEKTVLIN